MKKNNFSNNLIQFISYSLIGGSNVLINFAILNFLSYITKIYSGGFLYVFDGIAFIVYSINGYHWNKKFTFKTNDNSYPKYALVLGISAFFNSTLFVFLTTFNKTGIPKELWLNVSKLISSILIGTITFLINKFFVFKEK